jgi:hypothetical protein
MTDDIAQENARLEAIRIDIQQCNESLAQENGGLKIRVRIANARIRELEAERDAIRAKTIEECAKVAKLFEDAHDAEIASSRNPTAMLVQGRQSQVARDIAAAIRAMTENQSGN